MISDLFNVMGVIIQHQETFSINNLLTRQIRLHSEQLVIDVIEIMLKQELYTMPVFYNKKHIGIIHFKDLIKFLTHKELGDSLIYHKLNYDIESVMVKIAQMSEQEYLTEAQN